MSEQTSTPGEPQDRPVGAVPPDGQAAASEGLDPKIGGLLSYLLFGWIGGLIMFFTQKHPEVRFHAAQSIVVFGGWSVLGILINIFQLGLRSGILAVLIGLVWFVLGIGVFVLWIILCIKGYNLEHFKVPVAGDYAERLAASR